MNKENRQLVVYLSKSLKVSEEVSQKVRHQLSACGFLINEYKGGEYNSEIRSNADFMVLIPNLPILKDTPRKWITNVGKGQFGEVQSACIEDQPSFIYMGYDEESEEILMVKTGEDIDDHWIDNPKDWKSAYGTITSYVVGNQPVPLYNFITGYMEHNKLVKHNVHKYREYPLLPSEAFQTNFKLLLLR